VKGKKRVLLDDDYERVQWIWESNTEKYMDFSML